MRAEEYVARLAETSANEELLPHLYDGVPLGVDAANELVLSQTKAHPYTVRHTCVTGTRKTQYIRRLLCSLSSVYPKSQANFLIISPNLEYGELLKLRRLDATVPYIRTQADVEQAKACVQSLMDEYARGNGYPRLFVVLDGLETLISDPNGDLSAYRSFLELVATQQNIHIISGVELMGSIFSGNPGVFVGVGNCLVTTREEGRADVTYVDDDCSLSMPIGMTYPSVPSPLETIIYLNSLQSKTAQE